MPGYAILIWDAVELRWKVGHYTHKEKDLKTQLEKFKKFHKEENLEVMISCAEIDRKEVNRKLKAFLFGKKGKS